MSNGEKSMVILSIGEKIRKLREEKKMSLRELGGDYVSKAHLSYIENGKASPSIDLLEYLARRLDVELEYLLETDKEQARKYCNIMLDELEVEVRLENFKRVLDLYEKIAKLAYQYELHDILGKCSLLTGQGYIYNKQYDKAVEFIQESIYYCTKANDVEGVIKGYIKEGNIYFKKSLYEIAIQKYKQAYSFYNELEYKDLKLESDILYNISSCYHLIKDKEKAVKYAEKVCKIDERLKDAKRYAQSLQKYASTFILKEDFNKAKNILGKANKLLENEEKSITRAYIENNFGCIYLEEGDMGKAYKHLTKAKEIKEELALDELPSTLYELHKYYLKAGNEDKALQELKRGIELSKQRNLGKFIVEGLNLYVDFLLLKKDYNEAIGKMNELIEFLIDIQMKESLLNAYLKLGNMYSLVKNDKEALKHFKKAFNISMKNNMIKGG